MNMEINISNLECGDIMLCKSHSLVGAVIGDAFRRDSALAWYDDTPLRPSGHNGIFAYDQHMKPVVYEALFSGFQATPVNEYVRKVLDGECELKFARVQGGLTERQQLAVRNWCIEHLGSKYDFRAYLSFFWRLILRLPPVWNSQKKTNFFCTEAVAMAYSLIGYGYLFPDLPCPFTIEKLIKYENLRVVDEWFKI